MEEIKKDFRFAAKKALLDYILKEKEEKIRLGIDPIPDPPIEYGDATSSFKMQRIGDSFATRRANLEKNLILYSDTTQKILACWD